MGDWWQAAFRAGHLGDVEVGGKPLPPGWEELVKEQTREAFAEAARAARALREAAAATGDYELMGRAEESVWWLECLHGDRLNRAAQ